MGIILTETIIIIIFGLIGVYLIWVINGKKSSFVELLNDHGYTIGVVLFLIIALVVAFFRTFYD